MRAVRILVSHEILAQALQLPEGVVVYDCRRSNLYGAIELSLTSDQFPELIPGSAIPLTSAVLSVIGNVADIPHWDHQIECCKK